MSVENSKVRDFDTIIIGAGIIGLTIAYELINKSPGTSILILEKEAELGAHGSGRNSGVLHSGIYYPVSSLKAKVCASGARIMAEYCENNGLPIKRIGKVIVTTRPEDDEQIDLLYNRAMNNGAVVNVLDDTQLHEIEPEAHSYTGRAIHSPNTAVVDPKAILMHLAKELTQAGAELLLGMSLVDVDPDKNRIKTNSGELYTYKMLYNASGQFTDRVAHLFQLGKKYTLLPFKGIYYKLASEADIKINGLIYPVPDLNVPFLGVHSVKNISGDVYFGPTALPTFGREHYKGVGGLNLQDALSISYHLCKQYIMNKQGFRQFAHAEAGRFYKARFAKAVKAIVPSISTKHLKPSDKVGIRAQLLDREKGELVMDFVVEKKENTVHVLNSVSPAFTSAFQFAKYVISKEMRT